ncbi:nuclear transport factor 2 family protein [Tsuneonella sp. HG222]
MDLEAELGALRAIVQRQSEALAQASQRIALLEDKNEIERLQYAYGYFIDNRMFREMVDLFADENPWIEIGERGRYFGKERIHEFLLLVLGGGRWGLAQNEVINHVQQQLLITVDDEGMHARARARAEVQGNSPPDTPNFLFADGIYENDYVKEGGRWKIQGIRVTMTFYAALERAKIWFPTAPPSENLPPDQASVPRIEALGRQFNEFRWPHPITGLPLPIPVSDPAKGNAGGGGIAQVTSQ